MTGQSDMSVCGMMIRAGAIASIPPPLMVFDSPSTYV